MEDETVSWRIKDKLIGFPEIILDVLDEYKTKTGIPATDYIRNATIRRMIRDGLIYIKTKYINVEKKEEKKNIPPEGIKYCNGDSCGVQL